MSALAACAAPGSGDPVRIQSLADPQRQAALLQPGDAGIRGQGFLRQRGGGVVTCAGSTVFAVPAVAYLNELVRLTLAGIPTDAPPGDVRANSRQTTCDSAGNFAFTGLQPGEWMVVTTVRWRVGYNEQGGDLLHRVNLPPGGTAEAFLTEQHLVRR